MRWRYAVLAGTAAIAFGLAAAAPARVGRTAAVPFTFSSVTDLGPGAAAGINSRGQVVGNAAMPDGSTVAELWNPSTPNGTSFQATPLPGLAGATATVANAINDAGQIVGSSGTATSRHAVLWNPPYAAATDLGTLGGAISDARAINAAGHVAGFSSAPNGATHAFLYAGGMRDLGVLPGGTFSAALGIDDTEDYVVGLGDVGGQVHAFLYSPEAKALVAMRVLAAIQQGMNDLGPGGAIAIRWARQTIVGFAPDPMNARSDQPALWNGALQRLVKKLAQLAQDEEFLAINGSGAAVGFATNNPTDTSQNRALIYVPCGGTSAFRSLSAASVCDDVYDANSMVAGAAGTLAIAAAINNAFQVAGAMFVGGVRHAFVLGAPACLCSGIDMTVAPVNFTDDHNFEFKLNWTIHCTGAGAATCRGEIVTLPPCVDDNVGCSGTDLVIAKNRQTLACAGRCDRISKGTFFIVGRSKRELMRKARAGKTFELRFKLFCADTGQPRRQLKLGAVQSIKVVFDKRGFLDRSKSGFGKEISGT